LDKFDDNAAMAELIKACTLYSVKYNEAAVMSKFGGGRPLYRSSALSGVKYL
jgi:hypothetical protein